MEKPALSIEELIHLAISHLRDVVTIALEHDSSARALVVYDTENELTRILTAAYRVVLPQATFLDFNAHTKEEIIDAFNSMKPRDLVVLIQTTDFRLNEFRIRIQLFQRKLKVIDHLHLFRNTPDSWETYINALAYDPLWYRGVGHRLRERLAVTEELRILGPGTELVITGGLESPKPNLGDYTGMNNIGGTFPIGEVFTEAKDLGSVQGTLMIYAFANTDYTTAFHEPFQVEVRDGHIHSWAPNAPATFGEVIAQIRTNERAIIREIGFGLNRAISTEQYLRDITAFERILGLHVSLGEKHTVYKKPGILPDKTRYHVDVFPKVTQVLADGVCIYDGTTYVV